MIADTVLDIIHQDFPDVKLGSKDTSWFMKFLGFLLFFNPLFMTSYITTIGNTIYFPTSNYIIAHPVSSLIIILHELIHVHDEKRWSKPAFMFLYLFPQILFLPALLIFLLNWKLAIVVTLLTLIPWPAYFRMVFEKRAYLASLYVIYQLNLKNNYGIDLEGKKNFFLSQFKGPYYYYVWPFNNINKEFDTAIAKIVSGARPYDDVIFALLDRIILAF